MVGRSRAYASMRRALLRAVCDIPSGRVVDLAKLSESLDIPARHAAFMLARLSADERDLVPLHRVVPEGGDLGLPSKRDERRLRQIGLLRLEDLSLADDRHLALTSDVLWEPDNRHRATIWADTDGAG